VFAEESVANREAIGIQFLDYWVGSLETWLLEQIRYKAVKDDTYVAILWSEYDDFVKLGEICEEIIHARTFGYPPAVLSLNALFSQKKN